MFVLDDCEQFRPGVAGPAPCGSTPATTSRRTTGIARPGGDGKRLGARVEVTVPEQLGNRLAAVIDGPTPRHRQRIGVASAQMSRVAAVGHVEHVHPDGELGVVDPVGDLCRTQASGTLTQSTHVMKLLRPPAGAIDADGPPLVVGDTGLDPMTSTV